MVTYVSVVLLRLVGISTTPAPVCPSVRRIWSITSKCFKWRPTPMPNISMDPSVCLSAPVSYCHLTVCLYILLAVIVHLWIWVGNMDNKHTLICCNILSTDRRSGNIVLIILLQSYFVFNKIWTCPGPLFSPSLLLFCPSCSDPFFLPNLLILIPQLQGQHVHFLPSIANPLGGVIMR